MPETATEVVLSKLDVRALRECDAVSFHHDPHASPESFLSASRERKNAGPFDERMIRHNIPCRATFSGRGSGPHCQCFDMIHCCQYSETWRTVVSLVRPGDSLSLRWSADGERSGYAERCRIGPGGPGEGMPLHADALYLTIRRGKKTLSFLLSVSLCPDNTARRIKGATQES